MYYSNHGLLLIWEQACFTFSKDVKHLKLLIKSSQVLMLKYLKSIYVHGPELPPRNFQPNQNHQQLLSYKHIIRLIRQRKVFLIAMRLSKPCATIILILLAIIFINLTIILILPEHHLNSPKHPPDPPDPPDHHEGA